VIYSLREPEAFKRDRIVVVGGGDSAVEAALALSNQPGNEVKIAYRKDRFSRIKPGNMERIEDAITRRQVEVLWSTNLIEIQPDAVVFKGNGGTVQTMPNDVVAVFAGGELPTKFLRECGIEIDTKFGEV
jgi:thioredoxin reductase (NADPH)